MSEKDTSETEESQAATADGQSGETQGTTTKTGTLSIEELTAKLDTATKRIGELNEESKNRRLKLAEFEKAEKERKDQELSAIERLEEREKELKELQEQRDAADATLETYNKVLEEQYSSLLKDLDVQSHVQEAIKDRSVADRLQYINEHRDKFRATGRGVDLSGGKSGKTGKKVTLDDLKGLTPEQINAAWPNIKQ